MLVSLGVLVAVERTSFRPTLGRCRNKDTLEDLQLREAKKQLSKKEPARDGGSQLQIDITG